MNEVTDYFSNIIGGVLGRYYRPRTLNKGFLENIQNKTLLLLGTNDPLVGDAQAAGAYASAIPDLKYEILESGHLINVEQSKRVNSLILDFLE